MYQIADIFNLNRHDLDVHNYKKNKVYRCTDSTLCKHICRQRNILEQHIKNVHRDKKQFACSFCNSKFEQN